ncbi:MAG: rhodanese-like domain-containing protein [Duodenibacillus sp.]|nr:rhodanese-like domain-containing protein [Duodenibacillus sp.]
MNDFLINNILLIAIILVCSVSLAWPAVQRRRTGNVLDNQSATQLINRRGAQIIDLRNPDEFKKECLARSVNIPADRIQNELGRIAKDKPVLLVDNDGSRVRMAAPLLRGTGFKEVYALDGGLNAWRSAGMPFKR